MRIRQFNKEDFGYLVAFDEGKIGLYSHLAGPLCAVGADSDIIETYKLKQLTITPDFHLHSPLVVWLELTNRCNLQCVHCFTSAAPANGLKTAELSTGEIFALLDQLRAKNVLCVVFTGGEPLLRPDFLDIIGHASRLGFVIAVITNGLRLTPAIIRSLPRKDFRLTISLDNLHLGDEDDNQYNRRLSFLKSRLLMLKEQGVLCHAAATMTRRNLAKLKPVFAWLASRQIGFREIPFSPIGRGASCSTLQLTTSEVPDAAELWAMSMTIESKLHHETPVLTFDQCYDYCFTLVYMAHACKGARFLSYISANGDVFPCTICVGAGAFKIGNIKETAFEEIWERSAATFRDISGWDNFKDCHSCSLSKGNYFCTNRCPAMSLQRHGSPCHCGATPYDKASIVYRTKYLADPSVLIRAEEGCPH